MTIDRSPDGPELCGNAERLQRHESSRYRAAAVHARRVYPDSLGELAARELTAYAEFGYRFGGDALISRLAAEILAMPSRQVASPSPPGRVPEAPARPIPGLTQPDISAA